LIGEKSRKRTQRSGKPFLFKKVWHWRYVSWQVVIRTLACSTSSKFPSKPISCIVPEVCEALVEKMKDYIQVRQIILFVVYERYLKLD
jgi:hypothetical protein